MDLVSIIVPVYNMERYVGFCVDSILAQTYSNIEIILVDDGSTDGSAGICERYKNQDARIKVIHKKNGGVSAARNDGIASCSGDWITFVDSDDYIAPEFIEKLHNAAENKAEISSCCCMVCFDDREFEEHFFSSSKLYTDDKKELYLQMIREDSCRPDKRPVHAGIGIAWGKLYKRELLERASLSFDSRLSQMEDIIFNLRAALYTEGFHYIDEPLYYYRQFHRMLIKNNAYNEKFDAVYGKVTEKMMVFLEETSLLSDNEIMEVFYKESFFRIADTLKKCFLNRARKASTRERREAVRELSQRRANAYVIANASASIFKSRKIRLLLFMLKRKMYTLVVATYRFSKGLT